MKTDVDAALWDIADFYIKNRRPITEPELEAILKRHVENDAELRRFLSFMESEPGQMRFKTLLRERKESPTPPWMGKSTKEQTQPLDNVEVYTSELLPVDVTRDTGLHRDPEVEFRYTTHYYGADLFSFKRDLQKLLRERTGNVNLVVAAYYIERKFEPGEIVKYKGERVRVQEHIGDRVAIWIPSRQEEVWVKASQLEKEPSYLKEKPVERAGRCYELAWKHIIHMEEGTLIHGEVWSPKLGRMIGHAWVETETGYIYEPESGQYFKKDWLYQTHKAKEFQRYTPEQAAIMAARTKNFGPWTEAERKAFLKPSQPSSYLRETEPSYLREDAIPKIVLTPRNIHGRQGRIWKKQSILGRP